MKKLLALALSAVMMISTPVFANDVIVNGDPVKYTDQAPIIKNDRTYVPIRDVFESLDFDVEWDNAAKEVTLSNDYYSVMLFTQSNKLIVLKSTPDLEYKVLENPVIIENGRTMLPLREILESVGYELDFDAETKATTITDKNNYTDLSTFKETSSSIMDGNYNFKADPNKPEIPFNDKEKAYLEAIAVGMTEVERTFDSSSDNALSPETVNRLEKLINILNNTSAPESLAALDREMKALLVSYKDAIVKAQGFREFLADESDIVKMGINGIEFYLFIGLVKQSNNIEKISYDISVERNIDFNEAMERLIEDAAETNASNPDLPSAESNSTENTETAERTDVTHGPYVLNKNTMKIHYSDCAGINDIYAKNKIENVTDLSDYISDGYELCNECRKAHGELPN